LKGTSLLDIAKRKQRALGVPRRRQAWQPMQSQT
jgi:hypothetical protein